MQAASKEGNGAAIGSQKMLVGLVVAGFGIVLAAMCLLLFRLRKGPARFWCFAMAEGKRSRGGAVFSPFHTQKRETADREEGYDVEMT